MILLWLAVAALSVLAVLFVAAPLLSRRHRAAPSRRQLDLRIYREQLAEVDRDVERGLLRDSEAEAARTEVKRRILAVGDSTEDPRRKRQRGQGTGRRAGVWLSGSSGWPRPLPRSGCT